MDAAHSEQLAWLYPSKEDVNVAPFYDYSIPANTQTLFFIRSNYFSFCPFSIWSDCLGFPPHPLPGCFMWRLALGPMTGRAGGVPP